MSLSPIGLLALGLSALLALIVLIAFPSVRSTIFQMILGAFILVLGITLVSLLFIAITGFNIEPVVRTLAVALTGHRVVDFYDIFPPQDRVQQVIYEDTDGDSHNEWVVFYQFDLTDVGSPYAGAVYDYDRGDPPSVFSYQLVPPDRNYLSVGIVRLELNNFVTVGEVNPVPELLVYGKVGGVDKDLNIFRYIPNSLPWESPRDAPRAYKVIGSFYSGGRVTFDPSNNTVTVLNLEVYERSELAVKTVYALDETRGTYMSSTNPEQLGAPVSSEVIFANGVPSDILNSPFGEKLVLGFYTTLAQGAPPEKIREFLTGQALIEYDRGNLAYFGLDTTTGDVTGIKITELSYAPIVEQFEPNVTPLGVEPQFLTVSVAFEYTTGRTEGRTPSPIGWVTMVVNGQWKIDRRL
jgi:hypothetical protein